MSTKVVCVIAVLVLAATSASVSAISCIEGVTMLLPCLGYLTGTADSVTVPCCSAVDNLNKMASSSADRKLLCECFKKAAPSAGVKPDRAEALPGLCHIDVGIPIRPDIDCDKLAFVDDGSIQGQKFMLHN